MQPAASAGAILRNEIACGTFQGTIAPTTPTGCRDTSDGAAEHAGTRLFDRRTGHQVAVVAQQQRRETGLELLGQPDRHAVLHRHPWRRFGAAGFQFGGELFEHLAALLRMPGRPSVGGVECRPGGGDSGVDVGLGAPRHRTDPLLGGRGVDLDRARPCGSVQ